MTIKMFSLSIFLVFFCSVVQAGNVEIIKTEFIKQGDTWRVGTTLQHDDAGWKHFADAWRVVDEKGKELGKRILHHPHDKKPFTRYLPSLKIPAATTLDKLLNNLAPISGKPSHQSLHRSRHRPLFQGLRG